MNTNRFVLVAIIAAALAATAPGLVLAQVLEEIVVTAQKREQSLQDVGASVTAFSGAASRSNNSASRTLWT